MNNNNFKSCLYHILKKDAGISTELADEIVEDKTDILVRSFIKDIVLDSVIFLDELNGTDPDGGVVGELGSYIDIDQKSEPKFKDGDVLIYPDGTFTIYKYFVEDGLYMAHVIQEPNNIRFNSTCAILNATPATKEQRELLFAKMREAGYEWDAEKKELKKINKNNVWGEEDEHRTKDAIYFLETAKKHYAGTTELDACIIWLKSLKDRINGKTIIEKI